MTGPVLDSDRTSTLQDAQADARSRSARRRQREVVAIPRLRAIGNLWLWFTVAAHNSLVLAHLDVPLLVRFGAIQLGYTLLSTVLLARYYRDYARLDLPSIFLAADVGVFVLAIYVSGGERSWLLPLLCVRVADQMATSRRRVFAFASMTAVLHGTLVLYMAWVERRGFSLEVELAKVLFVYVLNAYLALAAGPSERQRKEAQQATAMARELVTELGKRTQQLESERARAEAASHAKGTFLANVSHEIRTPMNAVLGMTELLLEEPLPESQRKMAQTILTSGKSLLAIVNDVLDMSKVEAGELRLHNADLDVAQVVETVLSPMRVLADEKGLALRSELEGLPPRALRGDEMRLRQVLFNLTGNAIKFTQTGSVTIRVAATELSAESVQLRFSVRDTGIGMTEEAAKRVFDAFQQADESTTRKFGGTGLGLSISKKLVALMGGDLTVSTAPDRGSAFEFEARFALGAAARATEPTKGESHSAARLRALNPHVLVTEDTEVNRILLQRWLDRLGCRVSCAENGEQAVTALTRAHEFDLVFMDWHMPVLDGLAATEQIRKWEAEHGRPRARIIGFTASAFADEVERCRQAGMDDVLSKPLVKAQLQQKLYQHLLDPQPGAQPPGVSWDSEEPHVDPLVIAELRELDDGSSGLVQELLGNFLQKTPGRLRELRDAAEQRDAERVRSAAHGLRGSAGSVGAKRLSALATALEFQAAAEPMGDVEAAVNAMHEELGHVAVALKAELSRPHG
ncbi:MAG: ATP-binding protein [Polyangiales bacterium]